MDMLRSCYKTQMVFGNGADGPYDVEWYFCPDGAEPLPGGMHLFGSANWDPLGPEQLGPGEPWNRIVTYSKGALPAPVTGTADPCGEPDWFVTGVPPGTPSLDANSQGLPICCFPEPPPDCMPFYDGSGFNDASMSLSWTPLTWVLFFQDGSDVEFFDPTFTYFLDAESNGIQCTDVEGTMIPFIWLLPGVPTADSCQFVSYDPLTNTGTFQFFAGSTPLANRFLFLTIPFH